MRAGIRGSDAETKEEKEMTFGPEWLIGGLIILSLGIAYVLASAEERKMVKVPTRNEAYCAMFPGDPRCREFNMRHTGDPTTYPPNPLPSALQGATNPVGGFYGGLGDGLAVTRKSTPPNARRGHPDNRGIPGFVLRNPDKPLAKPNRTAQRFSRPLPDDWVRKMDHRYWNLDRPESKGLGYELK